MFLPPEISFLAFHGVHLATLWEAGRIAARCGVGADQALLRSGLVTSDLFYRALAREMRLPFIESRDIVVASGGAFATEPIRTGALRIASGEGQSCIALAPTGPDLLKLLGSRNRNLSGLAIVTPAGLRDAVLLDRAAAMADHAALDLFRRDPDLCFRGGLTPRQIAALVVAALSAALLVAIWAQTALIVLSLLVSLPFFALTALRIKAFATTIPVRPLGRTPRADDAALPVYTILVPLYREARVLPRLMRSLQALDYPAARLDIKIVIEADDAETGAALAAIDLPGCVEVIRAPPGHPRTKPRALNVALPLARGEFVAIYDAEDVPDPGQLRLAVSTFAGCGPKVACLQARLTIDNTGDGLIPRLFTIEYATLFDVINPALAAMDCPVPLGGTSNHFRTAILRDIGAWDAWNVTEDADLGMRLALCGYRVRDLPSSTLEEAPARLGAWLDQRTRWLKGLMQVCITHSRHPVRAWRRLGPKQSVCALAVTFGTVLSTLGFPFFSAFCVYALFTGGLLNPATPLELVSTLIGSTLFVAGFFAMIPPAAEALRRRQWPSLLPYVALMPLYYVLVSAAAWRGLAELIRKPTQWNKTEHGLARTSRADGDGHEALTALAPQRATPSY